MTRTTTQGQTSTTNQLDVFTSRFRSSTTTVNGTSVTSTNHYSYDTDNSSWTDSPDGYTRTIGGTESAAGTYTSKDSSIQWQLTNLHGDVVATRANGTTGLTATYITDEYGVTVAGDSAEYGYLGEAQRSTDSTSGFIFMGVRMYNPTTGRFLSVDPIYGGNANSYDYCRGDSINCSDISGMLSAKRTKWWPFTVVVTFNAKDQRIIVSAGGAALGAAVGAALCSAGTPVAMVVCAAVGAFISTAATEYIKEYRIKDGCNLKVRWVLGKGIKKKWRDGKC